MGIRSINLNVMDMFLIFIIQVTPVKFVRRASGSANTIGDAWIPVNDRPA